MPKKADSKLRKSKNPRKKQVAPVPEVVAKQPRKRRVVAAEPEVELKQPRKKLVLAEPAPVAAPMLEQVVEPVAAPVIEPVAEPIAAKPVAAPAPMNPNQCNYCGKVGHANIDMAAVSQNYQPNDADMMFWDWPFASGGRAQTLCASCWRRGLHIW